MFYSNIYQHTIPRTSPHLSIKFHGRNRILTSPSRENVAREAPRKDCSFALTRRTRTRAGSSHFGSRAKSVLRKRTVRFLFCIPGKTLPPAEQVMVRRQVEPVMDSRFDGSEATGSSMAARNTEFDPTTGSLAPAASQWSPGAGTSTEDSCPGAAPRREGFRCQSEFPSWRLRSEQLGTTTRPLQAFARH